jgi:hypothetical protein
LIGHRNRRLNKLAVRKSWRNVVAAYYLKTDETGEMPFCGDALISIAAEAESQESRWYSPYALF